MSVCRVGRIAAAGEEYCGARLKVTIPVRTAAPLPQSMVGEEEGRAFRRATQASHQVFWHGAVVLRAYILETLKQLKWGKCKVPAPSKLQS
jgi:hypothetical protein